MNKKAMSIPIVLLVLLTLVLVITTLFYFNIKQEGVKETILVPDEIDEVYVKEIQLNYYLQDIFDKSAENFKFESGKQVFIDNFKIELNKYKEDENWVMGELEQIENQISEENIMLNETTIILTLNLEILGSKEIEEKQVISVKYNYDQKFEKVFKLENI